MYSYQKVTDEAILILEDGVQIGTIVGDGEMSGEDLLNDARDLVHHLESPVYNTNRHYDCFAVKLYDRHLPGHRSRMEQQDTDAGIEATEIIAPNGGHIAYVGDYKQCCHLCQLLNRNLI